jgi:hypothetical protein
VSQCRNNEAFQVSIVVFNKTAAAASVLGNFLDHVDVTVISKAESVHSDVVSTSQTLLNALIFFDLGVFLTVCQHEDSGLRLVF